MIKHKSLSILIVGVVGSLGLGLPGLAATTPLPPALELKKVVSFPLSGPTLPKTGDDLEQAITTGLGARVVLPQGCRVVRTTGLEYPALDRLTVDLTNATISSDHHIPKLKANGPMEQGVHARQFRFVADPVKIDGADIHLDIQANDVELALQHDATQHPILVLAAAHDGSVQCDTTMSDLSRIFRTSAATRGKSYGLTVQQATLKLTSPDEHQLIADLKLASELWFVPIAMHFTAKVQVDDAGEAKLSNLTCDGDDMAGWLISGFIRPSLAKYNGKSMPLVTFPTDQIKLHDLRVRIDGDDVHVSGAFGK